MLHVHIYRAVKHVMDALQPYSRANGGPLKLEHITYVEERGNLIVKYKKVSRMIITCDRDGSRFLEKGTTNSGSKAGGLEGTSPRS